MRSDQGTDRVGRIVGAWRQELPEAVNSRTELSKRLMVIGDELAAAMRAAARSHSLTEAEHEVLAALRRQGKPYELSPTTLAADLLLTSGGISNVLRRLGDRGLVRRGTGAADGRRRWVRLTPEGRRLAETAVLESSEAQAAILARLSDDDASRLTTILRQLAVDPPP